MDFETKEICISLLLDLFGGWENLMIDIAEIADRDMQHVLATYINEAVQTEFSAIEEGMPF